MADHDWVKRNKDGTFKKRPGPRKKSEVERKTKTIGTPGRKPIPVDFDLVDNLCDLQCTGEEIAAALGVEYKTLEKRVKEKTGLQLREYIKKKGQKGKASLRRAQFKSGLAGNVTMQIWLGKQYLGQRDRMDTEITGDVNVNGTDELMRRIDSVAARLKETKPHKK